MKALLKIEKTTFPTFIFLMNCEAWTAAPCGGYLQWAWNTCGVWSRSPVFLFCCWDLSACPIVINVAFFFFFYFISYHFHPLISWAWASKLLDVFLKSVMLFHFSVLSHILCFLLWIPSLSAASSPGKLLFILQIPVLSSCPWWDHSWACVQHNALYWIGCLPCYAVAVQMVWTITYVPNTGIPWHSVCAEQNSIGKYFLTEYKIPWWYTISLS